MNRLPEPLDEVLFPAELFRPESVDKPAADDGVVANSRLTATLGASLVLILSAVGVTLLDVEGLIEWHAALGIAAGVVVLVKLLPLCRRRVAFHFALRLVHASAHLGRHPHTVRDDAV